ncbi:DUF11 domain-containing protein, partial [Cetobacterium somerae]|uniref:DUF11 domain-containing protein n=2 Tax=Cetobacterium somerae TaxID=188913 RepID=UPI00211E8CCA
KDYVVYDELLKNNLIASKDVTEPTVTGYDLFTENTAKVTVEPGKPITIKYTLTIPDLTTLPEGTTLPATISNVVADQKVDIVVDKPKVNVLKTALSGGVSVSGKTFQPGDKIDYTITLSNSTSVPYVDYEVYDELLTTYDFIKIGNISGLVGAGSELFTSPGAKVTIPAKGEVKITYTLTIPTLPETLELPATISNIVANEKVDIVVDEPEVVVSKTALSGESSVSGKTFQPGDKIDYTITLSNSTSVPYVDYEVYDELLTTYDFIKIGNISGLVGAGSELFTSPGAKVTIPGKGEVKITYTLTIPTLPETLELPATISNIVANQRVDIVVDEPEVVVLKTSDKTGETVQPGDVINYTITAKNTGGANATNYVIKDTLLSNPLLTKPTVSVIGGELTGDIFETNGGVVTISAQGETVITYSVTVPENYSNKTILNSVNGGENITIEVDKPVVKLRHDVFAYEEKFDNSDELINQDEGIVTDFENIENKNSNPPVILPGNKAIHFISLINPSKVDLKGKSDINHQLDGKQLKDDEGNPAFSEHKFQGIVLTNLDTNEKVFYSEKELNGGQTKAKNTRIARMLPEANELKITPKTSSFTFEEKIPLRTAIFFVFSSTVNPEGTFNKNTRISSYAFLPFDSEQNTSEGELRKAVIVIGRREADLVLSKSVEVEEASIGKFVPYTIEIKNMGKDPVDNIIISDKLPPGFTYVEGSAVQELKEGYAQKKLQVIGTKEIEIGPISQIKSGETIVIKYLLKVGVGVKPGTYKNIAVVKNENKENISNTDSVDIDIVADPIFEHTTVIGKVFHDRDRDGIQDYADARKAHITVNIPKEYYVKNTTTVSKDGKTYSFADNYETITIRNIKGRVSELEPATNNMVVIRKELVKPVMANVRVQTFGGTDITQQGNGKVITNHTGDKVKGMTSQDIVITQRVIKNKDNKIILEIFILNNGIQEEGLPGVRLATPEGIVVETDRFGRYHVPPVPETLGKNYVIKVDPTTLPKGAEFTTENPRVRHLGKVMMKFNFGVKLPPLKNPEKKDN